MGVLLRVGRCLVLCVVIVLICGFRAKEPATGEAIACDDLSRVASEFMELELSGARWQGGDSPCVPKLKLKLLRAARSGSSGDPSLLDPEYLLPKSRKVGIQARRLPQDLLELKISYLARKFVTEPEETSKAGRNVDVPVHDVLILKLQFGRARAEKGCATLHKPPAHFVMREGCAEE
jgi:hypothetical protein